MGKRILVADDSATIQTAFAMVLAGNDFSVVAARSQDEALGAAKQARPDLVIADAALGNGSGYDLCAALKGDPGLRGVPVVILASNQIPYDETRGKKAGADGHLIKPFDSQALIDSLSELLAQPSAAPRAAAEPAPRPPVAVPVAPERAAPPPARPAPAAERVVAHAVDFEEEESYGEFTIERSSPSALPPSARPAAPAPAMAAAPAPTPVAAPARPAPAPAPPLLAAPPPVAPSLRPSLIPGARPGMMPPVRPSSPPAAAAASAVGASPSPVMNRTMMGMPAVIPPLGSPAIPGRPTGLPMPVAQPLAAPAAHPPAGLPRLPTPGPTPPPLPVASAISSAVAQKMSTISARGPEYEAIAKLSREVIEQVVWEVVPELAEVIIRQEVDRLANAKR